MAAKCVEGVVQDDADASPRMPSSYRLKRFHFLTRRGNWLDACAVGHENGAEAPLKGGPKPP
jgi:hypothetical protein